MIPPGRVPDAELLRRFAGHRDEAAFELLVWRYDRLVRGVCRRTAGDHHAAEDAAQAAFLLLARKADRIADPAALPGPTDADRLQGEWLIDSAADQYGDAYALSNHWDTRFVFRGDTLGVRNGPFGEAGDGTRFTRDPTSRPRRIDWQPSAGFRRWHEAKAETVRGIYEWDRDGLRVCLGVGKKAERPTDFAAGPNAVLFRLERWRGKPDEKLTTAKVTVKKPDGSPAVGAEVGTYVTAIRFAARPASCPGRRSPGRTGLPRPSWTAPPSPPGCRRTG